MKLNEYTFDYLQDLLDDMEPSDLLECYVNLNIGQVMYDLWFKNYIEGRVLEPELHQGLETMEPKDVTVLRLHVLDRMY